MHSCLEIILAVFELYSIQKFFSDEVSVEKLLSEMRISFLFEGNVKIVKTVPWCMKIGIKYQIVNHHWTAQILRFCRSATACVKMKCFFANMNRVNFLSEMCKILCTMTFKAPSHKRVNNYNSDTLFDWRSNRCRNQFDAANDSKTNWNATCIASKSCCRRVPCERAFIS